MLISGFITPLDLNLTLPPPTPPTATSVAVPSIPVVVIEEQQETVVVTVGQYYEVRCTAQGSPSPQLSWSRTDNLPLPPEVTLAWH